VDQLEQLEQEADPDMEIPMRFFIVSAKCIAAASLITTGTFLLVLPGTGIPLIAAGIAILATEFAWAESVQQSAVALWQHLWHAPPVVDFSVEVH